jgi:hypothetical protein
VIGITFEDKEAKFLRDLLHWYSASTFGPNSVIAYNLYACVDQAIKRDE